MKYKAGDRVVCTKPVSGNAKVINQRGTILNDNGVEESQTCYSICFDNYIGGHSLEAYGSPDVPIGHGWWCFEKELVSEQVIENLEFLTQ